MVKLKNYKRIRGITNVGGTDFGIYKRENYYKIVRDKKQLVARTDTEEKANIVLNSVQQGFEIGYSKGFRKGNKAKEEGFNL